MNEDLLAVEKMENKIFYNDIGIFFLHRTLDHATFIISDGTYCIHPTIAIQFQLFNFHSSTLNFELSKLSLILPSWLLVLVQFDRAVNSDARDPQFESHRLHGIVVFTTFQ